MPRKPRTPKYGLHKPTGLARVRLGGNDVYLGKHGSPESYEKYNRVVAEYLAARAVPEAKAEPSRPRALSINELILRFVLWAEAYYRKGGKVTSEVHNIKHAMRKLKDLYGTTRADEFSPLKLKAVREKFIEHGYCREGCNRRARIITRMFRWAAENEYVPATVHAELKAVAGLAKGRTVAREMPKVGCVESSDFYLTLPHLPVPAADLLRFMALTGCRPGEACIMRPMDIDRSGDVWIYNPESHKTEHHDRDRAVLIGPKAQAVLAPYLAIRAADRAVFNPREIRGPGAARDPRQVKANGGLGRWRRLCKADHYTSVRLNVAVKAACKRVGIPAWSPNQLRHGVATQIQAKYSLDAARAVLGHASAQMTTRYAERDLKAAAEIMAEIG